MIFNNRTKKMKTIWTKSTNEIQWITNQSQDDFTAYVGDYTLRVERLDTKLFWWQVSYNGEELMSILRDTTSSLNRAIGLAEGLYSCHSLYVNRQREIRIVQSKINDL
jgi:hypothetical protein